MEKNNRNREAEDRKVMDAARKVLARGSDVELKRNVDGSIKVLESKKNRLL